MIKKLAFSVLTIAYITMFIAIGIQLFFMNGDINKNVVKIVKESEIVHDYENNIEAEENNLNKNVLNGFFIDKFTIITAAHGVNKDNSVYTIYDFEGNEYKAFLKEKDETNDIAYLEVNKEYKNYSKVRYTNNLDIGDEVYSLDYNGKKKDGKIGSIENKKISSNIKFEEGDSGTPLLNSKNKIVGINLGINLKSNEGISYRLTN